MTLGGAAVPTPLRDRKKASTRALLRATALRLFKERGFGGVSVDEIVVEANVSRSTFFRYFGSKEAVLLEDLDQSGTTFVAELRARPADEGPWHAFEHALVWTAVAARARSTVEEQWVVDDVLRNDPALRGRRLEETARWTDLIAEAFAERSGRSEPALQDRLAASTCMSVSEELSRIWREDPTVDAPELIRTAFGIVRTF